MGMAIDWSELRHGLWPARNNLENPDANQPSLEGHPTGAPNQDEHLKLTEEQGWRLAAVYGHGYRLERVEIRSAAC